MKLISILIPTYNRTKYLKGLIIQLTSKIKAAGLESFFDITVFNNASTDNTKEVLESLVDKGHKFQIVNYTEHVQTAEENVFRSFKQCTSEYVWVLGDDDVPVYENFEKIISILKTGKYDFLQFNNAVFNEKSLMTNHSLMEVSGDLFETSIVEYASYMGLWFSLAGMSGQIMRRKLIESFDLSELISKRMVIYSQVVAYIETFNSKPFAFVNMPLVNYKVTYVDINHWRKAANRIGFGWEHIWGIGTIEQLNYLHQKGVISSDFANSCFDLNDFYRFRFVFCIIGKVLSQVQFGLKFSDQKLSDSDMNIFEDFIIRQSPMFTDICSAIKDIQKIGTVPRFNFKLKKTSNYLAVRANQLLRNLEEDPFYGLFIQKINGVSIYKVGPYFLNSFEYPSETELRYFPDGNLRGHIFKTREQAETAAAATLQKGLPFSKTEHFSKLEFAQLKKISKIYLAFKDFIKRIMWFKK